MVSPAEVKAALDRLGSSADEIADSLNAKGIKGRKATSGNCPIARYLSITFPEVGCFIVGYYVYWSDTYEVIKEDSAHRHLPISDVHVFINQFDGGKYPNLIEEIGDNRS